MALLCVGILFAQLFKYPERGGFTQGEWRRVLSDFVESHEDAGFGHALPSAQVGFYRTKVGEGRDMFL